MSKQRPSRLRFNVGFLLEAVNGTSRTMELNYPTVKVGEDVTLSPLQGTFSMTRVSEGIYIKGTLHSTVTAECVRCLEDALIPIAIELDDIFYFPPYMAPEGEYTVGENGFINLAPLVREMALLDVPMQPLCKPDCLGLCPQCGQNLNEGACACEEDDIDPRLAALRQLLE